MATAHPIIDFVSIFSKRLVNKTPNCIQKICRKSSNQKRPLIKMIPKLKYFKETEQDKYIPF